MPLKSVVVTVVCALALSLTSVAAGAPPTVFTVYGAEGTETLVVDRNGNGQGDPGDILAVSGPLTDGLGTVIGTWQAQVQLGDSALRVLATFRLWNGGLVATGSFDPNAATPPSLAVIAGFGMFRAMSGTLTVGEGPNGGNAFTFKLQRGRVWHP